MPSIRVIAVGVLIHRNHLLCMHGFDSVKSETYYRPLGGGIEFGERAADAVVREIREEIGREVEVIEHPATTESIFTYEGRPYHQFAVELVVRFRSDAYPPGLEPIAGREEDGSTFEAHWLPVEAVLKGDYIVYPEGLPDRLGRWLSTRAGQA